AVDALLHRNGPDVATGLADEALAIWAGHHVAELARDIHRRRHQGRTVAGQADRHLAGLAAGLVVQPEVAAVLELDGRRARAGPLGVELGEVSHLAMLFRCAVVMPEVQAVRRAGI